MTMTLLSIFTWTIVLITQLILMLRGDEPSWIVTICASLAALLTNIALYLEKKG